MSSEIVIKVEGLGKAYQIYRRPIDRLKQFMYGSHRKFFDEYWALRDLNLEIYRGETVGIIGRNGSGKSTFLQLVYGTLNPSQGQREVRGRIAALLELGAGFNPEFTGRENVFVAASILGLSRAAVSERLQGILDFAGIGDFIDQPVKLYSSGMYARLAFAVAAHVDADILIIDEILSVGDAGFTQKCMRFIHEFKKHGTILFVSHDTGAVVGLCDRCVWLENGALRQVGPAKEVSENYLAALSGEQESPDSFKIGGSRKTPAPKGSLGIDHRHALLKDSNVRNQIEVFDFDPNAPWFGKRGATIVSVVVRDTQGNRLLALSGGEEVILEVEVRAEQDLTQPIVGFYVKDRLGQRLFGDNTYITYRHERLAIKANSHFSAEFKFNLPYLPSGDYSISTAASEGTQENHVHHHWIEDAVIFKVISSHVINGLVGIPMHRIEIKAGATTNATTSPIALPSDLDSPTGR
jgi:lipopolysaccharide transport system ATP-binding protein